MADLKKTVAIEFETNASKAAADFKKMSSAEQQTAKASKNLANQKKNLSGELSRTKARIRNLNLELRNSKARLADASAGTASFGQKLINARGQIAAGAATLAGMALALDRVTDKSFKFQAVSQNLPFSINEATNASQGLTDKLTLMRNAITANRLGVAKTSEEYANIVEVGQKLALSTGQDAAKGVADLTTALARQSPMILDNLGISLKLSDAYKRYADRLGIATSELTETQKKQAFMTEALAMGEKAAAGVELQFDETTQRAMEFKTTLVDLSDTMSVEFMAALSHVSNGLDKVLGDVTGLNSELEKLNKNAGGRTTVRGQHPIGPGEAGFEAIVQGEMQKQQDAERMAAFQRAEAGREAAEAQRLAKLARSKSSGRGRGRSAADDSIRLMSDSDARAATAELRQQSGEFSAFTAEEQAARDRFDAMVEIQADANEKLRSQKIEHRELMREEELVQIEMDIAMGLDPQSAAQRRIDANIRAAEEEMRIMRDTAADRREILEQESKLRQLHTRKAIAEIEKQKKAERDKVQALRQGFSAFRSVGQSTIQLSQNVAAATTESSERQAKIVNKIEGVITLAKGVAAIAQGAVEVAAQNYGKGIPMIIAGTAATVTGGLMMANPLNPPGASGGGGGGGGGGVNNVPTGPRTVGEAGQDPGATSPISRPDTSTPESSTGTNATPSPGQQGQTVVIQSPIVLGATKDEVGNGIRQLLEDTERSV